MITPTRHSGVLIQSVLREVRLGGSGSPLHILRIVRSDLVVPSAGGGFAHIDQSDPRTALFMGSDDVYAQPPDPTAPWDGAVTFVPGGPVAGLSLIQSTFSNVPRTITMTGGDSQSEVEIFDGNLEVVANVQNQLVHYWRDVWFDRTRTARHRWNGPSVPFAEAVRGSPALIQSTFGMTGDFELVFALPTGGLTNYWRANDQAGLPWRKVMDFAQDQGTFDAIAMAQNNDGSGNLEVVARRGGVLVHFTRRYTHNDPPNERTSFVWVFRGVVDIGDQSIGVPAMIVDAKRPGTLELVAPLQGGGVAYVVMAPGGSWGPPVVFGTNMANFALAGMFQDVSAIDETIGIPDVVRPTQRIAVGVIDGCAAHYFLEEAASWSPPLREPPPISFVGTPASFQVIYPRAFAADSHEFTVRQQGLSVSASFPVVFTRPVNMNTIRGAVGFRAAGHAPWSLDYFWPSEGRREITFVPAVPPLGSGELPNRLTLSFSAPSPTGPAAITDDNGVDLTPPSNLPPPNPPVSGAVWWTTYGR